MRRVRKHPANHIYGYIEVVVVKVRQLYYINILKPVQEITQKIFYWDLVGFMFLMRMMDMRRCRALPDVYASAIYGDTI